MPSSAGSQIINLKYVSQSDPKVNIDSLHIQFP